MPVVKDGKWQLEPVVEYREPTPVYQRWWFWAGILGGAAAATFLLRGTLPAFQRSGPSSRGVSVLNGKPLFSW